MSYTIGQRLKRKIESPRTKVNRKISQLPHAAIRKTLFFHHVLIENIRNKYKNAQGERESHNGAGYEEVQAATDCPGFRGFFK